MEEFGGVWGSLGELGGARRSFGEPVNQKTQCDREVECGRDDDGGDYDYDADYGDYDDCNCDCDANFDYDYGYNYHYEYSEL